MPKLPPDLRSRRPLHDIGTTLGVVNRVTPFTMPPESLQEAVNVDLDNNGGIIRRPGYGNIYPGVCHSMWGNGAGLILFREGANLNTLNADNSATTIMTGLVGGQRMAYVTVAQRVYFSDGLINGVYDNGAVRTWGMALPPAFLITDIAGTLRPGRYHVYQTYTRTDGQESGATYSFIDSVLGGLNIPLTVSADPDVQFINVYLSDVNGTEVFLWSSMPNATTTLTYAAPTALINRSLKTKDLQPPPVSQVLTWLKGRIYFAVGNVVFYTEPFLYEFYNSFTSYMIFNDIVTMIAGVTDGLYVGTTAETYFVTPSNVGHSLHVVAEYGVVFGTGVELPDYEGYMWMSRCGVCVGRPEGEFKNLTYKNVSFVTGQTGAGIVMYRNGMKHYVCVQSGIDQPDFAYADKNRIQVTLPKVFTYSGTFGEMTMPKMTMTGSG